MDAPDAKISFRAECDACHAWQHACRNCKFYKAGAPHDCTVPGIEPVIEKEEMNYCEEFKPLGIHQKKPSSQDAARRLFGDDADEPPPPSGKDRFHGLFGD
ncbi:MAG: hypothetical protein KDK78_05055 [Chlamydiia bacterium]|nr:hypothetical protein [Chlamydiia bacterium]